MSNAMRAKQPIKSTDCTKTEGLMNFKLLDETITTDVSILSMHSKGFDAFEVNFTFIAR